MKTQTIRAQRQIAEVSDRFLAWYVNAWILFTLGLWVFEYVVTPTIQYPAVIGLVVGLCTRLALKVGRTVAARWIFITPLTVVVSAMPVLTNGARAPILATAPMLVLLGGWLLGRRFMMGLAVWFGCVILGFAWAQIEGGWTPPLEVRSPVVFAVTWASILGLTTLVVRAMLSSFESNVYREVRLQTELAESELLFRTLLTSLHDGILLVNDTGRIEYANEQLCKLFSLDQEAESLAGLRVTEIVEQISSMYDDPAATVARWNKIVAIDLPRIGEEISLKNGRTLLRDYIPFKYADGRLGRVWHVRDVTALRNAQAQLIDANHKLEVLSTTDGLTGLANRRQFDQVLLKEWSRCQRQEQSLALILLDVDWFKNYNDQYGHQAGDHCLIAVARVLQSKARRASDLAARYGGEEFALIAPETDLDAALALAESVRTEVRSLELAHEKSPLGVITISLGVAAFIPNHNASPDALLLAADQALYQAKNHGRDRVEAAHS